jgi:uncharacterized surface protein with fasciclin (FAS1) repeats
MDSRARGPGELGKFQRQGESAMRKFLSGLALVALTAGTISIVRAGEEKDIIETARAAGQLNTFLKVLAEAGMIETLKGEGPFTVFVPSDEAFARLPGATLDSLSKDKTKLKALLNYHIVPGRVMSADVAKLDSTKTLEGRTLSVTSSEGTVMVNKAKVVKSDIRCGNGVIHVIDAVCLPAGE